MSSPKDDLTFEQVDALLSYDPDTGLLSWRLRRGSKSAGGVAGFIEAKGYLAVGIYGRAYKAHRIAWLLFYGEWPSLQLDHKDNVRTHNWISNLRPATALQNGQNKRKSGANTSGVKGVHFNAQSGRWRAAITVGGKHHSLGLHDDIIAATAAYAAAADNFHKDFARTA